MKKEKTLQTAGHSFIGRWNGENCFKKKTALGGLFSYVLMRRYRGW